MESVPAARRLVWEPEVEGRQEEPPFPVLGVLWFRLNGTRAHGISGLQLDLCAINTPIVRDSVRLPLL